MATRGPAERTNAESEFRSLDPQSFFQKIVTAIWQLPVVN